MKSATIEHNIWIKRTLHHTHLFLVHRHFQAIQSIGQVSQEYL